MYIAPLRQGFSRRDSWISFLCPLAYCLDGGGSAAPAELPSCKKALIYDLCGPRRFGYSHNNYTIMAHLLLPNELLLHIFSFLDRERDMNALVQSARPLYNVLNHSLYTHNIRYQESSGLAWAARHGRKSTVQMMLEEGAKRDACGDEEWQPMCMAVIHGHADVVQLFLDEGERPQIYDNDDCFDIEGVNLSNPAFDNYFDATKEGWDPFMLAVEHNQVSVARVLLQNGARITETEVLHAAQNGVPEMMELFLEFKPDLLEEYIEQSSGPLGKAAYFGKTEMVRYLLNAGADPDMSNLWGATPLAWAAHSGDVESTRLLLERGACPDPALPSGLTLWPLRYAAERGHIEVAKLILDHIDLEEKLAADERERAYLLVSAAACGWEDLVRRVLETGLHGDTHGSGRNSKHHLGSGLSGTPLSWAIERGHAGIVELLLQHGANPDPAMDEDSHEQRLIVLAVKNGHVNVVRLLLDWGVIPNPVQRRETSPLVHASKFPSIFKILLERGADPEIKHYALQKKPISFAIHAGNMQTVQMLLARGSKIETSDDWLQWQIISDAAEGGIDMLELVSRYGILPDPKHHENQRIMKVAMAQGQEQVVRYFVSHGFEVEG